MECAEECASPEYDTQKYGIKHEDEDDLVLCWDSLGQKVKKGSTLLFHSQDFRMAGNYIKQGVATCFCPPRGQPGSDPQLFFKWSAGVNCIQPKTAKFEVIGNS